MINNKFIQLLQSTIKIALIEDMVPVLDNLQYINNLQSVEMSMLLESWARIYSTGNNSSAIATARIFTRQHMIFCGKHIVDTALNLLSSSIEYRVEWYFQDGEFLDASAVICRITAPVAALLLLERTMLNFMQLLSATATTTRDYVNAIADFYSIDNQPIKILDTRKTIPHLRILQKYAVKVGGGYNQRFGLYDAILIKENNLKNFASIKEAVAFYKNQVSLLSPNPLWQEQYQIQIEVGTIEEFNQALAAQVAQIMLDNMNLEEINTCVQLLKAYYNRSNARKFDTATDSADPLKIELEVSGDINLNNIRQYAATGIHRISVGSLTKNINAINLSMLIE